MAAMPIYGKSPSKTTGPISTKLGLKHWGIKYHNLFINHDFMMTLTCFTARLTLVGQAFEWEKLDPRGQPAPTPGQYTCILQKYSKIFFETAWLIKAKFYMKYLQEGDN